MKFNKVNLKQIVLILGTLLLLTSCYSNPEDLEKIKKLENKNTELENSISKLEKDKQNDVFEKNKECGLLDKEIKEYLFDPQYLLRKLDPQIKEIFFSPKNNSCLVVYSYQGFCENNSLPCFQKDRILLDFFTKKELEKENSSSVNKLTECMLENNDEGRFDDCNKWYDFDRRLETYK